MCLYDLLKAFDSVEFSILLKRLCDVSVKSKTWRILQDWYTDSKVQYAWVSMYLLPLLWVEGCDRGPILSPAPFLLVMDPLFRQI